MPNCPSAEEMATIVQSKLDDLHERILELQTLAARLEQVSSYLQSRSRHEEESA